MMRPGTGYSASERTTLDRNQSRRCAISLSRWFAGTLNSSIALLIALCSSGASKMPTNWAGVPRMWYTAQEWVCCLVGRLAIARRTVAEKRPGGGTDEAAGGAVGQKQA